MNKNKKFERYLKNNNTIPLYISHSRLVEGTSVRKNIFVIKSKSYQTTLHHVELPFKPIL